ncbi:hypothetical protein BC835DRAFT_643992 [Cytidiella melzeri]|nr:hypothetical protein BC835DRAFT_643992 [Cytidiella melzeri]
MPSNGHNKRHYASEEDEGASSFAASRGDKTGSNPLTRSNHHSRHTEQTRHSSTSKADMRDDAASSSSRTYYDNDDRRTADDRYDYSPSKDGRRRGKRDEYHQRARASYSDSGVATYSHSSVQQTDSYDYDRDYDDSTHDPSSWTPRKDIKGNGRSHWGSKDVLGGQRSDRGWAGFELNDRFTEPGNRDDATPRERQRDNGWASRRTVNGNGYSNVLEPVSSGRHQDGRTGDPYAGPPSSSQKSEGQRKKKKHKKSKAEKQSREWRSSNDDTHLNKCVHAFSFQLLKGTHFFGSWTRRDSADYSRKSHKSERKRYRSSSRSPRSRSPAESYYSRRSSRGRSRSFDSPRHRRADSRGPRSRSPHDRPGKGPPRRWSRSPSRSPRRYGRSPARSPARSPWSPEPRRRRSRGRSLSTASTISRSPSRSPRERSRPVHRLPLATSAEDLRKKISLKTPIDLPPRPVQDHRNGDSGSGKRKDVCPYFYPIGLYLIDVYASSVA